MPITHVMPLLWQLHVFEPCSHAAGLQLLKIKHICYHIRLAVRWACTCTCTGWQWCFRVFLASVRSVIDFTIKLLSSRPLKLWSHRYVCAAIAVRGTELFTSSSFSYSLTTDVILYPFFLALLISSRSIHSLSLIPTFFHPPVLRLVFFPLPHSALTPLLFLSPPSPSPRHSSSTSLHSISLQYCQPSGDSQPSLLFIY